MGSPRNPFLYCTLAPWRPSHSRDLCPRAPHRVLPIHGATLVSWGHLFPAVSAPVFIHPIRITHSSSCPLSLTRSPSIHQSTCPSIHLSLQRFGHPPSTLTHYPVHSLWGRNGRHCLDGPIVVTAPGLCQVGEASAQQGRLVQCGFTPLCLWPGWVLGTGGPRGAQCGWGRLRWLPRGGSGHCA